MALSENEILSKLGPLAALAGSWEGAKGIDEAPGADRGLCRRRSASGLSSCRWDRSTTTRRASSPRIIRRRPGGSVKRSPSTKSSASGSGTPPGGR